MVTQVTLIRLIFTGLDKNQNLSFLFGQPVLLAWSYFKHSPKFSQWSNDHTTFTDHIPTVQLVHYYHVWPMVGLLDIIMIPYSNKIPGAVCHHTTRLSASSEFNSSLAFILLFHLYFVRVVLEGAGEAQASLARELAEYEMLVERGILGPMSTVLEVRKQCKTTLRLWSITMDNPPLNTVMAVSWKNKTREIIIM